MKVRPLTIGTFLVALVALPAIAEAIPARATGSVNLRTGPGTGYARITTVPAGARIDVYDCSSWCSVNYRGYQGWVSASYVSTGGPVYREPAPAYRQPVYPAPIYRPAPPAYGYYPPPPPPPRYYRQFRQPQQPGFSFGFGYRS